MQGTVQLSEDRHSQRLPGSRDQSCQARSALPAEIGGTRPQSFPSLEAVAFLQGNLTGTGIGGARKWNSRKTFNSRRQVYTPSQKSTPSILSLLYRKAWSATNTVHIQTMSGWYIVVLSSWQKDCQWSPSPSDSDITIPDSSCTTHRCRY